jgi:phosphatidylglycerol---prolipoprotein diacylglyceryl transferase
MLTYPNINPIALNIGPISIRWYGITYLLGFLGAFCFLLKRGGTQKVPWNFEQISDLLFYAAIGVIFGGTLGQILFYEPGTLLKDPLALLRFWEPGRSFHGGLIGVLLAVMIFSWRHHRRFFDVTDFIAPAVPIGLGAGRLGNFMNAELWGRVTTIPWGMVFPYAGSEPRHPSQLYEFFLEGVLLFIILYLYSRKSRPSGMVSGLFLVGYGIFRFIVEFFREPELSLGIFDQWITMGQVLSIPMIVAGLIIMLYARHNKFS